MKTSPKQPLMLNQLLFTHGCSVNILSHKTGIPVERLEQMFAQADATEPELALVAQALEQPSEVVKQVFNCQTGNFNQHGKNQRQRINTRDRRTTIKVKNVNIYIQVAAPASKPAAEDPNSCLELPQPQANELPLYNGTQRYQVGRSLTSGTHGF